MPLQVNKERVGIYQLMGGYFSSLFMLSMGLANNAWMLVFFAIAFILLFYLNKKSRYVFHHNGRLIYLYLFSILIVAATGFINMALSLTSGFILMFVLGKKYKVTYSGKDS